MDVLPLSYPDPVDRLRSLLTLDEQARATLEVGTAYLKAGTRMPDEGVSAHPRHEVSIILEGELETTSGGKNRDTASGRYCFNTCAQPAIIHGCMRYPINLPVFWQR